MLSRVKFLWGIGFVLLMSSCGSLAGTYLFYGNNHPSQRANPISCISLFPDSTFVDKSGMEWYTMKNAGRWSVVGSSGTSHEVRLVSDIQDFDSIQISVSEKYDNTIVGSTQITIDNYEWIEGWPNKVILNINDSLIEMKGAVLDWPEPVHSVRLIVYDLRWEDNPERYSGKKLRPSFGSIVYQTRGNSNLLSIHVQVPNWETDHLFWWEYPVINETVTIRNKRLYWGNSSILFKR